VYVALLLYALGVVCGLLVMRDRFIPRLVTALLWPVGPLAGVLVVGGLLLVSVVLWPVPMLAAAALAGGLIYLIV